MEICDATKFSIDNVDAIKKSDRCSCYYCMKTFDSNKVYEYIDNGNTALCPSCGSDSVIAGIIDRKLLSEMWHYWFIDIVDNKHRHSIIRPRIRCPA